MKNIIKIFVTASIAVLAFAACTKNDQKSLISNTQTVNVTVKANVQNLIGSGDTKTYIGTYNGTPNTIIWGENEFMTIMLQSGESSAFATSDSETANSFNGKNQATFKFAVEASEAAESYVYGGVYPASCAINWNAEEPYSTNTNASAFKVSLPSIQNATSDSYDPAAYIMVAAPTPSTEILTEWMANYRRATALNKVTLTNIPEDVVSVEFTAPEGTYMAGRRYINLTTGESGDLYGDTRTETIEVKANLSGDNKVVWFTSWETDIPANSKLKIVAKSSTKKYTRELTARDGGINFREGYLNTLKVNMASAEVEDIDDLSGNYLILASVEKWQIMANYSGYNYFYREESSIPSTTSDVSYSDFADIANIENYIWTVSEYDGGYSFKNNGSGKYLNLDADGNYATESDNPVAFSLTISDNNVAVLRSNTYSERVLMYNSGSPRFAFYKGTQKPIYMIKAVIEPRCADPIITYNAETGYVTITCSTEDALIGYSVDGTDPTPTNISYTGPFQITGRTTIKAIAGGISGYKNSNIVTEVFGDVNPASDGDVLWAESFLGFSNGDVPTEGSSQTTVYGGGNIAYSCVNGSSATKIYEDNLAGGSSPELLIGQINGCFTVSNIPTGAARTMTLTFKANKHNVTTSTSTSNVEVTSSSYDADTKQYLVTISAASGVDYFSLSFTNTYSSNVRVDDFNLIAGALVLPPVITANPVSISLQNTASTGNTIDYSISYPVDGEVLNATTSSSSWIKNIQVEEDCVTFDVLAQSSGAEERTGVILLSYQGAENVEVTVHQAAGPGSTTSYTLTPAKGSNNNYASNCDIDIEGITWNLTGNSQQLPWRIGGKSLSSVDRALYSKDPINFNVSSIVITHGAANGITINSMTVIVASDSNFNNVISTLTPSFVANDNVSVTRPNGTTWNSCYYKIIYNVTVTGTSNKFLEFSGAIFQ